MEPIIQVEHLSKTFGSFHAVQDLSFSVQPGDIYGFLGQNGAGKSTTMRMMLGLIRPDSGEIRVKGAPFRRTSLQHVGAIIERPDLYGFLSGLDNLRIFSRLSGIGISKSHLDELLDGVSLKGREHDKVKAYSQGMKQRLGIAIALVHDPDILMLDEPTNGLDPQGIADMRRLIISLAKERGKTVIISSHLLSEVEQMANRMLIIHRGKKIVEGTVAELLRPEDTLTEVLLRPSPEHHATIAKSERWSRFLVQHEDHRLVFKMQPDLAPELIRWLVGQGAEVLGVSARHSLEDYFLSLTSQESHVATAAHRTV